MGLERQGIHMPSQLKQSPPSQHGRPKANMADTVQDAANAFIVGHYPFGCLGGTPRRLVIKGIVMWIVPVFFTSPGIGPVGEVGAVAVHESTKTVIGSTERQDVAHAVKTLKASKRNELEAAFLRARTA